MNLIKQKHRRSHVQELAVLIADIVILRMVAVFDDDGEEGEGAVDTSLPGVSGDAGEVAVMASIEEMMQEFDPAIGTMIMAIFHATSDPKERAGLSLVITGKFIGATCRIVQENDARLKEMELPELIREVGNMVAAMIERKGIRTQ